MSATQAGESDNLGSKARPPRIAPVEPPYSPTIESMLKKWMKNKPELEVLNIYRTFAVHDELGPRTGVLGAGILAHGRLSAWEREILIHRVTARAGAEYEWGIHATLLGRPAGFTDEHLYALVHGDANDVIWNDRDRLLIRAADELVTGYDLSDELWRLLSEHWRPDQLLEIVITVGWYRAVSLVINVSRVELENWQDRFPRRR